MWRRQNSHPFDDDWWNMGPRDLFDQMYGPSRSRRRRRRNRRKSLIDEFERRFWSDSAGSSEDEDFGGHFNDAFQRHFPRQEFPPGFARPPPLSAEEAAATGAVAAPPTNTTTYRYQGPHPPPYWMMPHRTEGQANESGASRVSNDEAQFAVNLDVRHFKPEEVKVSTVEDVVVVEGKHEEQMDEHGSIFRHFIRKYKLPKDVDQTAVSSSLTRAGLLSITAPKIRQAEEPVRERRVPIKLVETAGPSLVSGSSTSGNTASSTTSSTTGGTTTSVKSESSSSSGGGKTPTVINHEIKRININKE